LILALDRGDEEDTKTSQVKQKNMDQDDDVVEDDTTDNGDIDNDETENDRIIEIDQIDDSEDDEDDGHTFCSCGSNFLKPELVKVLY
jgi:hypothetical protein